MPTTQLIHTYIYILHMQAHPHIYTTQAYSLKCAWLGITVYLILHKSNIVNVLLLAYIIYSLFVHSYV